MGKKEVPKNKSIDAVLSYLQTKPDIGGFVVQKTDESIEFDACFSDEFLGQNPQEMYSTMVISIAAMRNIADDLTKRIIDLSGISEDQVKQNIADVYYEIEKNKNNVKY